MIAKDETVGKFIEEVNAHIPVVNRIRSFLGYDCCISFILSHSYRETEHVGRQLSRPENPIPLHITKVSMKRESCACVAGTE